MATKKTPGPAGSDPGVPQAGGIAVHPDAPEQNGTAAVPPTAPEPAKRARAKAEYVIQKWVEGTGDHVGYWDDLADEGGEFAETFVDTAAAVRHVREKRVIGRLRVVAVKRELTVEEVQTTTLRVS